MGSLGGSQDTTPFASERCRSGTQSESFVRVGGEPSDDQAMGEGDPAGAFESRAGQRLDCVHGGQWTGARTARPMVRRLGDGERRRDPRLRPFDPFPFPFLTMTVSLEAIFLALFVLASQNRLARQADKRSHLDLQINLLAEREMTAVLQLLQDIARHLDVRTSVTPEQLRDLMKKTDLQRYTLTIR
jgi:Protein of unknown function (DUF1003)